MVPPPRGDPGGVPDRPGAALMWMDDVEGREEHEMTYGAMGGTDV